MSLLLVALPVCSPDEPPVAGHLELRDGDRDEYGLLPAEVNGYRVTRGATAGYVPDQACKDCHEDLYLSYQSVGMARSFYRLSPATAVEDFGEVFHHSVTGYNYVMFERRGKYFQRRYCEDEHGAEFASHEVEVTGVIGSGNHARTYVSRTAFGEIYELPMSWYNGKGWGMSPGFDTAGHDRFERTVTRGCMFCHNAYPELPVGADLPGSPHLFPSELPEGIGCQRCHGPGARHIEAATGDATDAEIRERILNPAHFTPRQSEDLCMTCHMQPDVSSGGESISRAFDKAEFAHRPDESILDYVRYFDFGSAADRRNKIEVNHHGHRMRQSRCYTASDERLSCLSCHDPHRKVEISKRPAFYRAKCLQCHELTDCQMAEMGTTLNPAVADCVSCHMLEARPRDVVHVTITDHLIRRRGTEQDLTAARQQPEWSLGRLEVVSEYGPRGPTGAQLDLHRLLAKGPRLQRDEASALAAALRKLPRKPPAAYLRVSRAIAAIDELDGAVDVLRAGVQLFPKHDGLLAELAMALHRRGDNDSAMGFVERSLAVCRLPGTLELRANLLMMRGELEPARVALTESLRMRPVFAETWRRYGRLLTTMNRRNEAVQAFENAIARNPDVAEPYRWLCDLHLDRDEPQKALQVLRQGASRSLDVRLDLIARRAAGDPRLHDAAAALKLARAAVKTHPQTARVYLYLAFALGAAGREAEAEPVRHRARTMGADAASCTGLELLGRMSRESSGDLTELRARFERESKSPGNEPLRPKIGGVIQNLRRGGK